MTQGKNKTFKKKGLKKKTQHPFAKKEWYQVLAPNVFEKREATLTVVNKSAGQKKEEDSLVGRVFEISLADLMNDPKDCEWRKIKLQIEDVKKDQKEALTTFYGMDMTRDKICNVVKKWQTSIEAFVDVKTQDGYFIRMFCIAFTKKRQTQLKATCYAKSSQVKQIRAKMMEIMVEEAQRNTLRSLAIKFVNKDLEKRVGKACNKIFPLDNIFINKVKMLKKPKFDVNRLMESYSEKAHDAGKKVSDEAKNALDAPVEA